MIISLLVFLPQWTVTSCRPRPSLRHIGPFGINALKYVWDLYTENYTAHFFFYSFLSLSLFFFQFHWFLLFIVFFHLFALYCLDIFLYSSGRNLDDWFLTFLFKKDVHLILHFFPLSTVVVTLHKVSYAVFLFYLMSLLKFFFRPMDYLKVYCLVFKYLEICLLWFNYWLLIWSHHWFGDATLYDFCSFKIVFGLFCGLGYELYWFAFCGHLKIMCSLLFCGGCSINVN